jgi:two-component system, NarL family, sensor kinase
MPQNQVDIPWLVIIATIVLLIFTFGIITLFMRYQKRHNQFINEKNRLELNFQQELLQTQIEIQEQTLKTISQEIHDNIGQVLSLAKLNLNTLPNSEDPKIQDTKNLVSKAINDLRNLSHSMHGDIIAALGLQQSITNELRIIENTRQFATALVVTGTIYKLNTQKEMVLFRIVQEALHNIVKHSGAKNITVALQYMPDVFVLIVEDNGKGFDLTPFNEAENGNGMGIRNMHNRANLIGANFKMSSTVGNGTVIIIELPANSTN